MLRNNLYKSVVFMISASLLLFMGLPLANGAIAPGELERTIMVLDRARTNGIIQLQKESADDTLSDTEIKEFRTFLNYLGKRIYYYCRELEKTDPSADLTALPCNSFAETQASSAMQPLPQQPGSIVTEEEQTDELDGELMASLGQFDEMLLHEQDRIAKEKALQGELDQVNQERQVNEGGADSSKGQNASQGDTSNQQDTTGSSRSAAAGKGEKRDVDKQQAGRPELEEDDDIVARQLREAAEKETDPEIKERLWEEYRKYKKGVN